MTSDFGGSGKSSANQFRALRSPEELRALLDQNNHFKKILATREMPADYTREAADTEDRQFQEIAAQLSDKFSPENRRRIAELLEARKNDLPRFRFFRERLLQFLSGEIPTINWRGQSWSKEDAKQILDGISIDDYRYSKESPWRPDTWEAFQTPFAIKETQSLGNWKRAQVKLLVASCMEDVSYYGVSSIKPFGIPINMDHTSVEIYHDAKEDPNALFDHLFDKIPANQQHRLEVGQYDPNEIQIFPHPVDPTKVVVRFKAAWPAGVNKSDARANGRLNDRGFYDTRGGGYGSILVFRKSNELVQGLSNGKYVNLLNPILRTLAIQFNKHSIPVVDGLMCKPDAVWFVQDMVGRKNFMVDEGGDTSPTRDEHFSRREKSRFGKLSDSLRVTEGPEKSYGFDDRTLIANGYKM